MALRRPQVKNLKLSLTWSGEFKRSELLSADCAYWRELWVTKVDSSFFVLRPASPIPELFLTCAGLEERWPLVCKTVLVVFYAGHVNITGLRLRNDGDCGEEDEEDKLIGVLASLLSALFPKLPGRLVGWQRDNYTASGQLNLTPLGLPSMERFLNTLLERKTELEVFSVQYNREQFPGVFIRRQACAGTIILFNSGKFIVVGVRAREEIKVLHDWLEWLTWTALTPVSFS